MNNCQYCNTPIHLEHQQQAHLEQPCRGALLAEIARLTEENDQLRQKQRLHYRPSSYPDMFGSPGDGELPIALFEREQR